MSGVVTNRPNPGRQRSGFGDDLIEQAVVNRTGDRLDRAVGLHDCKRRLEGHVEAGEDFAGVVADLGEGEPVLVDESLEGIVVTGPCDSDEVDRVAEFLCCRLDRGGFTIALASSGSPEPKHGGLPRE